MAERLCGACKEPGHTRRTCPVEASKVECPECGDRMVPNALGSHVANVHGGSEDWERSHAEGLAPTTDAADAFLGGGSTTSQADADAFLEEEPPTPPERRIDADRRGYYVKDPRIGDFRRFKNGKIKPFTRATTVVKAASDRTALTDWNERNILIGAARHPEEAAKALVWDPEEPEGRVQLNWICDDLARRIGAKDAAERGTSLHKSVERWINGTSLEEIPDDHWPFVHAVADELQAKRLRPVPGLVERRVFLGLPDEKGIVGTFDLVVEELDTGRYRIADLKTGAKLDYAFKEIEAQLEVYRRGYQENGTYVLGQADNGSEDYWALPGVALETDYGVVLHLPALAGEPYCQALKADLRRGAKQLALCIEARDSAADRPKPEPYEVQTGAECTCGPVGDYREEGPQFPDEDCPKHGNPKVIREDVPAQEPEDRDWEAEFGQAKSKQHLAGLYESARSVFGTGRTLDALAAIGTARLEYLQELAQNERDHLDTERPPF